jgi:hypothetical protein
VSFGEIAMSDMGTEMQDSSVASGDERRASRRVGLGMVGVAVIAGLAALAVHQMESADLREEAEAACERWAEKLATQTTPTGSFIRPESGELPENDPWGHPLVVVYREGGLAESLEVRSLGPEGVSHSSDDLVATRHSVTLKGMGTAVKEGIEETAENASRGLVRGAIDGVRKELRGDDDEKA